MTSQTSSALHLPLSAGAAQTELGALPEWNLSHLYPGMDSEEFRRDLAKAEAECKAFAASHRGKLDAMARGERASETLSEVVKRYEALEDLLGRLMSYAGLVYSGDTTDPVRAKFYGDTQERLTAASTELLFFALELNRIEDAVLDEAMSTEPLKHYRPWIEDLRKDKPFQLDDRIEQLFHEKSVTGRSAWNRLFDETMASLRFNVRGEELPIEPTLNKLQDSDESVRKDASDALAKTFKANLRTFTLITNTLAKDKEISDRWRGFEDVADSRHLANRVEREVVEAMVSAVREAYPRLSHRYYALKARWFGKDKLDHWDRNAPLPKVEQRTISWNEARDTVLSAYSAFSPRMADIARRFFDEGWIDAPTRPGKAPGAFAHPTVPSAHPYVLLNYQGKPRDVMTLAHELGHGVHQVMAGPNGALMAPTPLTLAETASVFGEMLTFRRLLDQTTDPVQRKAMLAAKVEDMLNTVVRQIAFYAFERKVHLERRNGELTADKLCELWMSVQDESLGPAIRLGPGYESFWTYIPHFIHSPFYVYAYAFGDCLVNSLYGVYER
ncbi:MAG: oligoendopeptidase, partial [Microvirga sp.]|nr:oligoendopeptidase [Microvirga sp.]